MHKDRIAFPIYPNCFAHVVLSLSWHQIDADYGPFNQHIVEKGVVGEKKDRYLTDCEGQTIC